MEDPSTKKVTGVSIDIVEEIARQLGAKVEWKRLNWNTMSADLKRGDFDFIGDPIFQTPLRAREFAFTEPYSYFAIGIGVVRKGDSRFLKFDDINRPEITVVVGQGFGEEALVRARAPNATINAVPVAQDSASPINAVLTGRADIAIANLEDARRFIDAHPNALEALWTESPPAYVPAGFALRRNDLSGAEFLNTSLRSLDALGVLTSIAKRYGAVTNMTKPQVKQ
jgi:ABC-type amino acid transport substrate-binding protein